jgi:hypothetical protein
MACRYAQCAFAVGAIAGGLVQAQVGYAGLLAPIAVLLAPLPIGPFRASRCRTILRTWERV